MHLIRRVWREEHGSVNSAELVLIVTLLVIGAVVGLTCVRNALVQELCDTAKAIGSINQSFHRHHRHHGHHGGKGGNGQHDDKDDDDDDDDGGKGNGGDGSDDDFFDNSGNGGNGGNSPDCIVTWPQSSHENN